MPIEFAECGGNPAMVRAAGLCKRYTRGTALSRRRFHTEALIDVNLEIPVGSITALIGESGAGKSTLAGCLAMIEKPDRGEIWFDGQNLGECDKHQAQSLRPRIQMVFQDSSQALNPRFSANEIIAEPLILQKRASGAALRARTCELMKQVGLSPEWADRRASVFSGGQRQRLAIARAIALQPEFLIFDESLSGLDLSTQAQILNLLLDLQQTQSLTYLFVSHDLTLVAEIADFVAVMQHGRIVEYGSREQVMHNPQHAYTQSLVSSTYLLEAAFHAAGAGR